MKKGLVINAFRWDGTHESTQKLAAWFPRQLGIDRQIIQDEILDSHTLSVTLQDGSDDDLFRNGGQVTPVHPGDWVVADARAECCLIMDHEEFEEYCLPKVVRKER